MKKFFNFIVEKHRLVLVFMLVLCLASAILIPQVHINTDMTKYLSDDSSMKIGMDIMGKEFPDMENLQTIRVMFADLSDAQKAEMLTKLEAIPYVGSVAYDANSEDYNKDNYTLYVISTEYDYNSKEESAIKTALQDDFSQYDMAYKNNDVGSADIPPLVIAAALIILLIVLFVMCSSWIEPILFMAAIGVAVIINMGTNIVLGEISNITFSICAILQLVLSMDYSIILMNRYRQELEKTDNKLDAMKSALTNAFSSIASSGMTTVVGLLMLIFMSFTIGMDLGLVLAKGVAISMISVFTVLPGLILISDNLIRKTAKKHLNISMKKVAGFSFRFRYLLAGVFVVLFVGSYFLQGFTQTTYTRNAEDAIADVFPIDNTIVMLYSNQDEESIAKLTQWLEADPNFNNAISYPGTLGKPYTVAELTDAIADMGSDIELDPAMLNILYYNYFTNGKLLPMTVSDFIAFIANDVAQNDAFAEYLGEDIKANIDTMKQFADAGALTKPMTASELAEFFGMEAGEIEQLFLYYYMQNGGVDISGMTLPAFAAFANEIAQNEDYASMFDSATLAQLQMLSTFTNKNKMTQPISYAQGAKLLGMEQEQMRMVFVYYYAQSAAYQPSAMTVPDFVQFIRNDVATNPMFAPMFDEATIAQLDMLARFTNKSVIQTPMTSTELAGVLGMEPALVAQLFSMYYGGDADGKTISLEQFVDFLLANVVSNEMFAGYFDESTVQQLTYMQALIKASISGNAYSHTQIAQLLGMDSSMIKMVYTYHDSFASGSTWKLSMQTVVNFLVRNSDQFGSMLEGEGLAQLKMAQKLINGSVAGTVYTSKELASLVGMDASQIDTLYLLYTSEHGDTSQWKLSVQGFVNFVVSDVLVNENISSGIDAETAEQLKTAKTIIDAVVSGSTYTAEELSSLLGGISQELDTSTMELLYLYHASTTNSDANWKLSMEELFAYLSNDIVNDARFEKVLDQSFRNDINDMKTQMDEGIAQLKGPNYSILMLNTTLPSESAETSAFIEGLLAQCEGQLTGEYYLIGDSPMNYEMENSFDDEMLLITLLTAISIFIVVALTFRSICIPAILVLIVQCGVYITISVSGLLGYSIYFLALLIVQCILMGATIDYGILFTNYYREHRKTMERKQALEAAYHGSIHTILTSGLIMILVTGIIGFCPVDPTISQICQTISIGALSATLLILFILPGLLTTFDRFVVKRPKKDTKKDEVLE